MARQRTYTDAQLVDAIKGASSWRAVLRGLGLAGTSASAMRSARAHADRLGVDYGHFRGQRRWTDRELDDAVRNSTSWAEVLETLKDCRDSDLAVLKGHAARMGLDVKHLVEPESILLPAKLSPELDNLHRAGSLLAAAWFAMCGCSVSWPLEPSRYDLIVDGASMPRRIQVKTTTVRAGASWKVYLSTSRQGRSIYSLDEIDEFFIIDGDLDYYLIPVAAVAGLHAIHLGAYKQYKIARLS